MSPRSATGSAALRLAVAALVFGALAAPAAAGGDDWNRGAPDVALVERLRAAIALAGALLLGAGAWLRGRGRPEAGRRARDALLLALSALTLFAWLYPYRAGFGRWFHYGDAFHYYLGGKYFPELGYRRLYHCAVIADAEAGLHAELAGSRMRDLASNRLVPVTAALADPAGCKRHFSAARWRAFLRDVDWFRRGLPTPVWQGLRRDHGFNAPPAWLVLGALVTHTGPASARQLLWLTLIDPALLALALLSLAWGFGWRAACLALLFWGTNQTARWEWVGGSILRLDWLAACVAGIACLRRGHPRAAGLLLAAAGSLRIFPLLLPGALALAELLRMLRARSARPSPSALRFGVAFASGLLIALAASSWVAGGTRSWAAFVENSRLHLATPHVNRVGLGSLIAYDPDQRAAVTFDYGASDPFERWRRGRLETAAARWPLRAGALAGYLALLVFVLWRRGGRPEWLAAVLGVGAIPFAAQLSNYYLAILLAFAALGAVREEVGAALLLLAAASWWVRCRGDDCDVMYVWHSAAILLFVLFATARALPRRGESAAPG